MSDEEDYEYEYDDDDEEMEDNFEYTDDENEGETNDIETELENSYYNAKGLRDDDDSSTQDIVNEFESVITKEKEELSKKEDGGDGVELYGPWSFKSIKQIIKVYLRSNNYTEMMKYYHRLLNCISSGTSISPNAIEKGINGMLDRVSQLLGSSVSSNGITGTTDGDDGVGSSSIAGDDDKIDKPQVLARNVYDSTIKIFHPRHGSSPNERLWFKTNLKYGQLLYEMNETNKLQLVLKDLKTYQQEQQDASAMDTSSSGSSSTSTHLMEIYALQIQLYSKQKDHKKLRSVFTKAMAVRGGIPHPRTLALIQELGGKMHMSSKEYEAAGKTFFQAFKSYDEAGDPSRLKCLKYLVMASMLHASTINPFDSQEARPYRDDPEIVQMTNLVQSFHNNDISRFESILRKGKLLNDEFVREHVEDLLRTIRTQVLKKVIRPYTRISLAGIARELNDIPIDDVKSLLVSLILDGTLEGQIDQVTGTLIKKADKYYDDDDQKNSGTGGNGTSGATPASLELQKCNALEQLANALEQLSTNITSTPSLNKSIGGGHGSGMSGMIGPGGMRGMVH